MLRMSFAIVKKIDFPKTQTKIYNSKYGISYDQIFLRSSYTI